MSLRSEYAKELDRLLEKRDAIRAKQMRRYAELSATRAKTTTSNAEADRCNERIVWLREEIRKLDFADLKTAMDLNDRLSHRFESSSDEPRSS